MDSSESNVSFKLYVAGDAPNSRRALANLKALCLVHLAKRYVIEVVDVHDHPRQALDDCIFLTPQLVIARPPRPARVVVGDLSDCGDLFRSLGANDAFT